MNEYNEAEFIETVKGAYLQTKMIGLIPYNVFDILVGSGEIVLDKEEKIEVRQAVEKSMRSRAEATGLKAVRDFVHMKNTDKKGYEIMVRNECKRRVVAIHFNKMDEIDRF